MRKKPSILAEDNDLLRSFFNISLSILVMFVSIMR